MYSVLALNVTQRVAHGEHTIYFWFIHLFTIYLDLILGMIHENKDILIYLSQ
jgi:hypothetical protein